MSAKEDKEKEGEETEEKRLAERPSGWFFRPLQDMDKMFEDIDRTFERFFGQPLMRRGREMMTPEFRSPAIDIQDQEDKYMIQAEMPGIDKEGIELEVMNDRIKIKGESETEEKEEREGYIRKERGYKSFYREIPFTDEVVSEEAEATYENGILEITLPKKEKEKKKGVNIKVK